MAEAVALNLVDAETVALSLEEGEQVELNFTEEIVQFEVLGEVGAQGPRGWAGTMAVGTVDASPPGGDPSVVNVGTVHDAVLDFVFPRGDTGPQGIQGIQGIQGDTGNAATVDVGATTTGTPGTDAAVTNVGDQHAAVFDFVVPRGDKGDQGDQGDEGTAATITIGDVDTGLPGSNAAVVNTGTTLDAVFDFDIPRGDKGDAATITIGDVDASAPGAPPTVTNVGTIGDAVLDFVLPRGDTGPQGPPGLDTGFYRHDQNAPSALWSVNHNLGYYPSVFVQDSAGSVVYGDVNYIDSNNLTIAFHSAFGGYANLS